MDGSSSNSNSNSSKKQTKGRQKIEMKKIENEDDRLITFSKRRSGIYKKASELATLCGAEVGVVVFSPAGKPFSFAHPCIESVANKFLNDQNNNNNNNNNNNIIHPLISNNIPTNHDQTHPLVEAHRRLRINDLNQQHNHLLTQLDAEKEKGKALEKLKKVRSSSSSLSSSNNNHNHNNINIINGRGWWETPTEELGIEELQQVDGSLGDLYQNVCHQLKQRGVFGSSSYTHNNNNSNNCLFHGGVHEEETIPFNILGNNNNNNNNNGGGGSAAAGGHASSSSTTTTTYLHPHHDHDFDYGQQHHHP